MQCQKNNVRAPRQNPVGTLGIQFVNGVTKRAQRGGDCGAGAQRHFSLGGKTAQHHHDVQWFNHVSHRISR